MGELICLNEYRDRKAKEKNDADAAHIEALKIELEKLMEKNPVFCEDDLYIGYNNTSYDGYYGDMLYSSYYDDGYNFYSDHEDN